jgi:E3 ubiquitin-protein ligase BAH
MKFGQVFKEALRNDGFPSEWIDSAISYSQLKKCINRLTDELAQLGLDPVTLDKLLKHVEHYNASAKHDEGDRPFEYILSDDSDGGSTRNTFHPKLLFYVNEATGALYSAKIDEETKRKLQMLAVETGMTHLRVSEVPDSESSQSDGSAAVCCSVVADTEGGRTTRRSGCRVVEVPLTSDTEFFTRLSSALSGLGALEEREEKRMHSEIEELGKQIAHLTDPDRRANKKLLTIWRQVFQMYVEEGIFFGTVESDHSAHDAREATARYQEFCSKIAAAGFVEKLKKKENLQALNTFMHINHEMLQGLRFGEINHMAMSKILKSLYNHL